MIQTWLQVTEEWLASEKCVENEQTAYSRSAWDHAGQPAVGVDQVRRWFSHLKKRAGLQEEIAMFTIPRPKSFELDELIAVYDGEELLFGYPMQRLTGEAGGWSRKGVLDFLHFFADVRGKTEEEAGTRAQLVRKAGLDDGLASAEAALASDDAADRRTSGAGMETGAGEQAAGKEETDADARAATGADDAAEVETAGEAAAEAGAQVLSASGVVGAVTGARATTADGSGEVEANAAVLVEACAQDRSAGDVVGTEAAARTMTADRSGEAETNAAESAEACAQDRSAGGVVGAETVARTMTADGSCEADAGVKFAARVEAEDEGAAEAEAGAQAAAVHESAIAAVGTTKPEAGEPGPVVDVAHAREAESEETYITVIDDIEVPADWHDIDADMAVAPVSNGDGHAARAERSVPAAAIRSLQTGLRHVEQAIEATMELHAAAPASSKKLLRLLFAAEVHVRDAEHQLAHTAGEGVGR